MVRRCAVTDCPSNDATTISHRFPRNQDMAIKWQESLSLGHIELWHLMQKFVVCTDHFAPSDYRNIQSKHLNKMAIPQTKRPDMVDRLIVEVDYEDTDDNRPEHVMELVDSVDEACEPQLDYEAVATATYFGLHDIQSEGAVLMNLADNLNFEEYIADDTPTYTSATVDTPQMQSAPAEPHDIDPAEQHQHHVVEQSNFEPADHHHQSPQQQTTPIIPQSLDVQSYLAHQLQTDDQHQDLIMQMDFSDPCHDLLELPDQLLVAGSVDQDQSDDENSDSYVYVMEMHVPDVVSDRLPTVLLDDDSHDSKFAINQSTPVMITDLQTECAIVAETTTTVDEVAINCLLSALAEPDVEQPQRHDASADDEDEPYALRDTAEVRLYNEMSKRSLIQLLVAANVRIRDLEQRLGTIESAHAKVLGSLEIFRSVLKR